MLYPLSLELKPLIPKKELENIKKLSLTPIVKLVFWKDEYYPSFFTTVLFRITITINRLHYLTKSCRNNLIKKLLQELKNENNLEDFLLAVFTTFTKQTINIYFFSTFNLTEFTRILISPPSLFEKYKKEIIEKNIKEKLWKYPETFVSIQLNLNTILFEELKEQNEIYANLLNQHQDRFDKLKFKYLSPEEKIVKWIEELKDTLPYTLEEITISLKNFLAILKWKEFDLNKFSQLNDFIEFWDIGFKKDKWKKKYIKIEERNFLKTKSWKLSKN